MPHLDLATFLGMLVVMLGGAKLGAALAQTTGQPAVLGELLAGVIQTSPLHSRGLVPSNGQKQ